MRPTSSVAGRQQKTALLLLVAAVECFVSPHLLGLRSGYVQRLSLIGQSYGPSSHLNLLRSPLPWSLLLQDLMGFPS